MFAFDVRQDSLAEWSKALASGAGPQGRGLEPHSCHFDVAILQKRLVPLAAHTLPPPPICLIPGGQIFCPGGFVRARTKHPEVFPGRPPKTSCVPGGVLTGSRWASDCGSRGLPVGFLVGFWWALGLLHSAPQPPIFGGLDEFKVDPKNGL